MKYSVDKIEDDICVLENLDSGEIIEKNINELPEGIHEGSIIDYDNEKGYVINTELEKTRRESLRERMEILKKLGK